MERQMEQDFEHTSGEPSTDVKKDTTRFTESVQDELNHHEEMNEIGLSSYSNSKAGQTEIKEYNLVPQTQEEETEEARKSVKATQDIKPNRLHGTSLFTVIILYLLALGAMSAEGIVYQSIVENVLGILGFESYLVASFAVVFTKFTTVVFYSQIKYWVNEGNPRFRYWFKTLLFFFVALILVNAVAIGINNIRNIEQTEKMDKILFLQKEDPGSSELGQAISELQQNNNLLFSIVRYCAIAFLGLLSIVCGTLLWALGYMHSKALNLKYKIASLRKQLSKTRSNFQYIHSTRDDLISLQKEIICLYGHKSYYEKLMSPANKDVLPVSESK